MEHGLAGFTRLAYDAPSPVHLVLLVLTAAGAGGVLLCDRVPAIAARRGARAVVGLLAAAFVVLVMGWTFPAFFAGPLAEIVQLGNLAIRTNAMNKQNGRNVALLWDGPAMKCTNVPEANRFVRNELRKY